MTQFTKIFKDNYAIFFLMIRYEREPPIPQTSTCEPTIAREYEAFLFPAKEQSIGNYVKLIWDLLPSVIPRDRLLDQYMAINKFFLWSIKKRNRFLNNWMRFQLPVNGMARAIQCYWVLCSEHKQLHKNQSMDTNNSSNIVCLSLSRRTGHSIDRQTTKWIETFFVLNYCPNKSENSI